MREDMRATLNREQEVQRELELILLGAACITGGAKHTLDSIPDSILSSEFRNLFDAVRSSHLTGKMAPALQEWFSRRGVKVESDLLSGIRNRVVHFREKAILRDQAFGLIHSLNNGHKDDAVQQMKHLLEALGELPSSQPAQPAQPEASEEPF